MEYPPSEEQIRIVLSTLNEINTPYILARGSPPDPIGAILPSLVQESGGRGLLGTWVKQFAVLQHPAILGFMTHGGSSSAMESIICGVPMSQSELLAISEPRPIVFQPEGFSMTDLEQFNGRHYGISPRSPMSWISAG